jgi:hypothetical protein
LIAAFTTQPKNINSHTGWNESSMRDLELFLPRQKSAAEIFMGAIMAFRPFLLFLVLGPMVFMTVISILDHMAKDPGYHLSRSDILSWEKRNGETPAGSVVMVRSDR